MKCYDRIDVSEGIDVNETREPKECDTFCYWYFSNKRFKFQIYGCNRCHDIFIISIKLSDVIITKIKKC